MKSRTLISLLVGILVNTIVGVTTANTVSITTEPIVIGEAIDSEFDGTFRVYDRFVLNRTRIARIITPSIYKAEHRAILEFDISMIPDNASIEKASLSLGWYSGSVISPRTNLYGYVGNGVLNATDALQTNYLIEDNLSDLWDVDVTSFLQYLVDDSKSYAGFLGVETRDDAGRNYGYFCLEVDYVPEPATVLLLGFGAVVLRKRR